MSGDDDDGRFAFASRSCAMIHFVWHCDAVAMTSERIASSSRGERCGVEWVDPDAHTSRPTRECIPCSMGETCVCRRVGWTTMPTFCRSPNSRSYSSRLELPLLPMIWSRRRVGQCDDSDDVSLRIETDAPQQTSKTSQLQQQQQLVLVAC